MDSYSAKKELVEMFRESIIIQSLVTATLIFTISYLWIHAASAGLPTEEAVPKDLYQITLIVLAFWFGQKSSLQAKREADQMLTRARQGLVDDRYCGPASKA